MQELRTLMENYWLDRELDREQFNRVRRELDLYRKFCVEQLGWNLIQNERIIKLEKIPAQAQSFMGISEFGDKKDYGFLCALLIFLDDKEDGEQFLLSELLTVLESQLNEVMEVDWTNYSLRKSLIRALQFAEARRLLVVNEGKSANFNGTGEQEVLYENTGLSRYFVCNFSRDISSFTSYRNFEQMAPQELDQNRGQLRTNRVYRRLVAEPAFYWQNAVNPDVVYLKNQRQSIGNNLARYLGGQLQIQRNCAFFVLDENNTFGQQHPTSAMLPELVLLFGALVHELVQEGRLLVSSGELLALTSECYEELVALLRTRTGSGWSAEYRKLSTPKVAETMLKYLQEWEMVALSGSVVGLKLNQAVGGDAGAPVTAPDASEGEQDSEAELPAAAASLFNAAESAYLIFYPGLVKLRGVYPKDFEAKAETEAEE